MRIEGICAVIMGLSIALTSCSPVLYQPHTPNIPSVNHHKPSEIKVFAGFVNFDAHYNHLDTATGGVYQGMASLRGVYPNSSQSKKTLRLGTGYGKYKSNELGARFIGLQLGFSTHNNGQFSAYDFNYINSGGPDYDVHIRGSQLHLATVIAKQYDFGSFGLSLSAMLDLNYSPRYRQTAYFFEPMVNHRDTYHIEQKHIFYSILNLQAQFNFKRYLQLSAGTKIPLGIRGYSGIATYYTTEYFYLRVGLWLKWK